MLALTAAGYRRFDADGAGVAVSAVLRRRVRLSRTTTARGLPRHELAIEPAPG